MSHHGRLRKRVKLLAKGCGCLGLFAVIGCILILGLGGRMMGWVSGAAGTVGIRIPNDVDLRQIGAVPNRVNAFLSRLGLSQEIRVPELPVNPFKLSQKEQIALGDQVAAGQSLDRNAHKDKRISEVSARLIAALPAKYKGPAGGWKWRFSGMKTSNGAVNAIALPGGRIYVYDGLIDLTGGNRDELAAVLGHEMAHVVEEHTAEKLVADGLLQKALQVALQQSGGQGEGGEQADIVKMAASRLGKQLTSMQLSQAAEYQADDLGFQFMAAAGYDPGRGLQVMRRLDKLQGRRESVLTGVFSTHPPTDKRLRKLQANMPKYKAAGH